MEGVEVICPVRSRSRAKLRDLPEHSRVRLLDYTSSEDIACSLAGVSADVIFNLASYGVRESDQEIAQLIEGNISILVELLKAAANWPLRRFIHTGSCSEYGFPVQEGRPIAESDPLAPLTLYGSAKASSVLLATALAARMNIPFVTLRLFGVFGTRESSYRLIPYIISCLLQDEAVDLTGGAQVRDLLFEDDVAEAFIAAATAADLESGGVYNVCSSRAVRIREIGERVAALMGKPQELLHWGERSYRKGEPMWLVGDNRRFRAATSWAPSVPLQSGIIKMVEHARELRRRGQPVYGV
jgi:nucleoside-diphosphate-sugar epimerase